jgi:hypothetical protein
MVMTVPAVVAGLLRGFPDIGSDEQAFPFLTVDAQGFPHVALLSRSEMDVAPGDAELLAAIASTRTVANLRRDGRAGLIAIGGTSAHYLKLHVVRTVEIESLTGWALVVDEHKEDSLGIPLVPMGFHATAEVAEMEHWTSSAVVLRELAAGRGAPMSADESSLT